MSDMLNRIKINSIADTGGKYIQIVNTIVFQDDTGPPTTWTTLNLSSLIPIDTISVRLGIMIQDTGADNAIRVSKLGGGDYFTLAAYVAGEATWLNMAFGVVECTASRTIQHAAMAANTNLYRIYLSGYYIPMAQEA